MGAIGSARTIAVDSSVLFDSGEYVLKEAAAAALAEAAAIVAQHAAARIVVAGHTDNVGSEPDNLQLATNRAEAVAQYLDTRTELDDVAIATEAYRETRPVASNDRGLH